VPAGQLNTTNWLVPEHFFWEQMDIGVVHGETKHVQNRTSFGFPTVFGFGFGQVSFVFIYLVLGV